LNVWRRVCVKFGEVCERIGKEGDLNAGLLVAGFEPSLRAAAFDFAEGDF